MAPSDLSPGDRDLRHSQPIAAQTQYQLVLCMLQKGDRAAATHELDLLTRNFPDQQDFIAEARKLIPGASTLLGATWTDGEASQLNIKRDGQFTGEYLYYAAMPWQAPTWCTDPRVCFEDRSDRKHSSVFDIPHRHQ